MCGRIEKKSPIRKAWDDKIDDVVTMFETVKKMWNGTVIGTGKAVEDEIKSMETLSNMDIGTFINVTYAILHLDETTKNMWHAFSSTVKRDIIDGDAESITQWTTYGLTQIGIGLILDKGLGRAGLVTKGAGGASTLAKGVTLVKELKQTADILQSFKKDVSYAFAGMSSFKNEPPTIKDFFVKANSGESKGLNNKIGKDSNLKKNIEIVENRTIAFNKAKDLAGIPKSQQPTRQWQVGDDISKKGYESKNYEYSANHTHHGRYYEYDTPQGKRVIVEHINDGVLHTHAGKPKDGANPYTYDFKKERYSNIYGSNNDHHIYYNKWEAGKLWYIKMRRFVEKKH